MDEESNNFVVKPTKIMMLVSEKGTLSKEELLALKDLLNKMEL